VAKSKAASLQDPAVRPGMMQREANIESVCATITPGMVVQVHQAQLHNAEN
jgi:hypothetical protein